MRPFITWEIAEFNASIRMAQQTWLKSPQGSRDGWIATSNCLHQPITCHRPLGKHPLMHQDFKNSVEGFPWFTFMRFPDDQVFYPVAKILSEISRTADILFVSPKHHLHPA